MDNVQLAQDCVRLVGGAENVASVTRCATRLRFKLVDRSRAQKDDIEALDGVAKVMEVGEQTQIVIGPQVNEVFKEVEKLVGKGAEGASQPARESGAADNSRSAIIGRVLDTVTGIFSPIIPVLTAGGMVKAVLLILGLFGLPSTSQEYYILNFIADSAFYFLPALLAFSSARKFGCNPYIAAVVGGVLLHPNWSALVSSGEPVSFFGAPVRLVSYGSSVLPIILTVLFMSFVERLAEKYSPNAIKAILQPLLTLGVTAPVALIVIGPLGNWIGSIVAGAISFLDSNMPILVPTIVGVCLPLLVFAGMHLAIFPAIQTVQLADVGYETVCGPGSLASNFAMAGATLAAALRMKKGKNRELGLSAGITALCGITEPALYGVAFKYHKPLISAMIGGGVAGLVAGIFRLKRYALATPGIPALPTFMGDDPNNIIIAIVVAIVGFAIGFVVSWLLGVKESDAAAEADN